MRNAVLGSSPTPLAFCVWVCLLHVFAIKTWCQVTLGCVAPPRKTLTQILGGSRAKAMQVAAGRRGGGGIEWGCVCTASNAALRRGFQGGAEAFGTPEKFLSDKGPSLGRSNGLESHLAKKCLFETQDAERPRGSNAEGSWDAFWQVPVPTTNLTQPHVLKSSQRQQGIEAKLGETGCAALHISLN